MCARLHYAASRWGREDLHFLVYLDDGPKPIKFYLKLNRRTRFRCATKKSVPFSLRAPKLEKFFIPRNPVSHALKSFPSMQLFLSTVFFYYTMSIFYDINFFFYFEEVSFFFRNFNTLCGCSARRSNRTGVRLVCGADDIFTLLCAAHSSHGVSLGKKWETFERPRRVTDKKKATEITRSVEFWIFFGVKGEISIVFFLFFFFTYAVLCSDF